MLIGLLGDVHGRAFHALAAVAEWQETLGRRFDLVVQVGDLGAYTSVERMDAASRRYLDADPSQADFGRLLTAAGRRAASLRRVRRRFDGPIYFICGNHEEFAWLAALPRDAPGTAAVDPFDLFRYVPDGTVLSVGGWTLTFLGGAEPGDPNDEEGAALDEAVAGRLLELEPGSLDGLVTHDGPYGIGTSYYGTTQGAPAISRLVERLRPRFHVAGHLHHLIGPREANGTTYVGLAGLGAAPRPLLSEGAGAAIDTETGALTLLGAGARGLEADLDFDAWAERS